MDSSNRMEIARDDNRASTLQDIDPGLQAAGDSRQLNEETDAKMAVSTLHDMNIGLGPRCMQQGGIPQFSANTTDQVIHSENRLAASTLTAMNARMNARAQAGEGQPTDVRTSMELPLNASNFGGNVMPRKV